MWDRAELRVPGVGVCREAATGRGVVFATRELLKASGAGLIADKTFVIQARCTCLFFSNCKATHGHTR